MSQSFIMPRKDRTLPHQKNRAESSRATPFGPTYVCRGPLVTYSVCALQPCRIRGRVCAELARYAPWNNFVGTVDCYVVRQKHGPIRTRQICVPRCSEHDDTRKRYTGRIGRAEGSTLIYCHNIIITKSTHSSVQ